MPEPLLPSLRTEFAAMTVFDLNEWMNDAAAADQVPRADWLKDPDELATVKLSKRRPREDSFHAEHLGTFFSFFSLWMWV